MSQLSLLEGMIAAPVKELARSRSHKPSKQTAPLSELKTIADYGFCRCNRPILIPGLDASRCAECGWISGGAV